MKTFNFNTNPQNNQQDPDRVTANCVFIVS